MVQLIFSLRHPVYEWPINELLYYHLKTAFLRPERWYNRKGAACLACNPPGFNLMWSPEPHKEWSLSIESNGALCTTECDPQTNKLKKNVQVGFFQDTEIIQEIKCLSCTRLILVWIPARYRVPWTLQRARNSLWVSVGIATNKINSNGLFLNIYIYRYWLSYW